MVAEDKDMASRFAGRQRQQQVPYGYNPYYAPYQTPAASKPVEKKMNMWQKMAAVNDVLGLTKKAGSLLSWYVNTPKEERAKTMKNIGLDKEGRQKLLSQAKNLFGKAKDRFGSSKEVKQALQSTDPGMVMDITGHPLNLNTPTASVKKSDEWIDKVNRVLGKGAETVGQAAGKFMEAAPGAYKDFKGDVKSASDIAKIAAGTVAGKLGRGMVTQEDLPTREEVDLQGIANKAMKSVKGKIQNLHNWNQDRKEIAKINRYVDDRQESGAYGGQGGLFYNAPSKIMEEGKDRLKKELINDYNSMMTKKRATMNKVLDNNNISALGDGDSNLTQLQHQVTQQDALDKAKEITNNAETGLNQGAAMNKYLQLIQQGKTQLILVWLGILLLRFHLIIKLLKLFD